MFESDILIKIGNLQLKDESQLQYPQFQWWYLDRLFSVIISKGMKIFKYKFSRLGTNESFVRVHNKCTIYVHMKVRTCIQLLNTNFCLADFVVLQISHRALSVLKRMKFKLLSLRHHKTLIFFWLNGQLLAHLHLKSRMKIRVFPYQRFEIQTSALTVRKWSGCGWMLVYKIC